MPVADIASSDEFACVFMHDLYHHHKLDELAITICGHF